MFSFFFKVAFRHFHKYRVHSWINILCLSVGFLSVILIGLFIDHELNYDKFHQEHEKVFRLTDPWGNEKTFTTPAILPNPWAYTLAQEFPEIETYTRVQKRLRFNPLLAYKAVRFFEGGFISVDSTFFRLFNFKLKAGDVKTALREPGSIVLTESKARTLFGEEDPLDKIITLDNKKALRVTGVLEDLPTQSHLNFNFIIPIDSLPPGTSVYSYFKVKGGTDIALLEKKIQPFLKERFSEKYPSQKYKPRFQSVSDIHLKSNLDYEFKTNGNINYLYLIGTVGFFILLIVSFNYINMVTALTSFRLKEFGMRKTLGGHRIQFIIQGILESVILCLAGFIIALALSYILFPHFSDLLARKLDWSGFIYSYGLAGLCFAFLVGVLSGAYPSFLLSGVRPVEALRGKFSSGIGQAWFSKTLVSAQFIISAILITGAIVIYFQFRMLNSTDLGFDRSHVIVMNGRLADGLDKHMTSIKDGFESLPEVEKVAFSQTVPGDYSNMASISYEFEGASEDRIGTKTIFVSPDFVEALGIKMAEGRDFSEEFGTDSAAYVINEACARRVSWDNPVGKRIKMTILDKMEGPVIGVMKDFHFASLHSTIEPIILVILPESFQKILIRTQANVDVKSTIAKLSTQWSTIIPDYPFEYEFMDQKFAGLYEADVQFSSVFRIFTIIAILLTCIGLYGMISFDIGRRMKEIGIRKVIGASVIDIFKVLMKTTFAIVGVSLVISIPITWYLLTSWLANFAYTISIQWWFFAASLLTLTIISVMTTAYRIYTASMKNPTQVLRNS